MKIGFDGKRALYNKSGLGNYSRSTIIQLSEHFPENNYKVYAPDKKDKQFQLNNKNVDFIFPKNKLENKVSPYWRSLKLRSIIENDKLDIYHGLSNELPFGIEKSETKSVVTIHDLIFLRYPELYKPIDRAMYKYKFANACKKADKIIAISEQTKNDIVQFFGINENLIKVVYQGCNKIFKDKSTEETKNRIIEKYNLPNEFILYVGTIEKRKNFLSIIKALMRTGMNIPVVAVGKQTEYINEIKSYIADKQLKNITFLQGVPNEDLPSIYQLARIFVYPSVFEGFGIPILEAITSGTPVITTKKGCFQEAGGDGCCYVDPLNFNEIGSAISNIYNDTNLQNQMIEKGLAHSKKFNDKDIANNLMKAYLSIH
jgi:glycosyltransferase involved in cell wall biosynthesis